MIPTRRNKKFEFSTLSSRFQGIAGRASSSSYLNDRLISSALQISEQIRNILNFRSVRPNLHTSYHFALYRSLISYTLADSVLRTETLVNGFSILLSISLSLSRILSCKTTSLFVLVRNNILFHDTVPPPSRGLMQEFTARTTPQVTAVPTTLPGQ